MAYFAFPLARPAAGLLAVAIVFACSAGAPNASAETAACEDVADIVFLPSPVSPWKGAPLRVLVASEKPFEGELALVAPGGGVIAKSRERHGGPPYAWYVEVAAPAVGTWKATLTREDGQAECRTMMRDIAVRASPNRPGPVAGSVWPIRAQWSRANENLFSAWIEKLFDGPLDLELSWPALHLVLRDKTRNFLFNHLALGEDQMGLAIRPDCADLPYFLRAYFAFKMGLPFGYSQCTRGDGHEPPKCFSWWNIQHEKPRDPPPGAGPQAGLFGFMTPPVANAKRPLVTGGPKAQSIAQAQAEARAKIPPRPLALAGAFAHYLQYSVADEVHSGSARTRAIDDNTDYYPVALTADTLRPGTVFADPYGHILMISKRIPQSSETAGVLLAVDAQPDGTVARKRFWRGNFLFAQNAVLGSPGFKRFRPVVRDRTGVLRRMTNAEIGRDQQYGGFSLEQSKLGVEDFYDRMDDVLSPAPLDPERALKEAITSLEEQVKTRVISVENGRKFQASGRGEATMPDGAAIFETSGAWEDFATPSRDLRLLIAIDVVRTFPERVARRPERFAMPNDRSVEQVKAGLDGVLGTELASRKFSYLRSDSSAWTLTLAEVVGRTGDLEMAYNVNDCVELRWGARDGSDEAATCKRHAPAAQRVRMVDYRSWFHERRRPPRG